MVEGNCFESPRIPGFSGFIEDTEIAKTIKHLQKLKGESDRAWVEMRGMKEWLLCVVESV